MGNREVPHTFKKGAHGEHGFPREREPKALFTYAPDALSTPLLDAAVIAGQEDLRNRPAPKLCRPRVVRVFEPPVERGREALDLPGSLRERSRQSSRHGVDERERRDLTSREHVRPDGDDVGTEMIEDPLVEALEAGRQERECRLRGELLHELLVELPPLGRERDDPVTGRAAVDRLESSRDDVHAQHHSRTTAVRVVVHLARAQGRGVAVVEDAQVELGAEHRSHGTALPEPGERTRDQREDVEKHDEEP